MKFSNLSSLENINQLSSAYKLISGLYFHPIGSPQTFNRHMHKTLNTSNKFAATLVHTLLANTLSLLIDQNLWREGLMHIIHPAFLRPMLHPSLKIMLPENQEVDKNRDG